MLIGHDEHEIAARRARRRLGRAQRAAGGHATAVLSRAGFIGESGADKRQRRAIGNQRRAIRQRDERSAPGAAVICKVGLDILYRKV